MKKGRKRLKAAFIVLFCFCFVVTSLFCLSEMKKAHGLQYSYSNTIYSFYYEKENSLDGIYLGSSAANRYWAPAEAFDRDGICVYNMGTFVQPFVLTKYLIREALKYQKNMKVVVVEIRCLVRKVSNSGEFSMKLVSDAMRRSENRNEMIRAYLDYSREVGADIDYGPADYYFPILRNNGAWLKEFKSGMLNNLYDDNARAIDKGFVPSFDTMEVEEPAEYTEREDLNESKERLLRDLLEYCKEIEPEVIFVSAPLSSLKGREGLLRKALDICEEEGFETLDFNSEPLQSSLDIDWSSDLYNEKHLNWYGAKKYTDFLADYLTEEYGLEDHRGDPAYDGWYKSVEALKQKVREAEAEQQ